MFKDGGPSTFPIESVRLKTRVPKSSPRLSTFRLKSVGLIKTRVFMNFSLLVGNLHKGYRPKYLFSWFFRVKGKILKLATVIVITYMSIVYTDLSIYHVTHLTLAILILLLSLPYAVKFFEDMIYKNCEVFQRIFFEYLFTLLIIFWILLEGGQFLSY